MVYARYAEHKKPAVYVVNVDREFTAKQIMDLTQKLSFQVCFDLNCQKKLQISDLFFIWRQVKHTNPRKQRHTLSVEQRPQLVM